MKEFIGKHPFLALIAISIVCDTIYNCVRTIRNPEATRSNPVQFFVNTKKE